MELLQPQIWALSICKVGTDTFHKTSKKPDIITVPDLFLR